MRISSRGIALIKAHEGKRLTAYLCPAGEWTIGYGHTSAAGPPLVARGMKITADEADAILLRDLRKFEDGVEKIVTVPLSQGRFDALVSLAFNIGLGALAKSSLLRKLNAGRYDAVPAEMMRWVKGGGRTLPGLVRRRRDESDLWCSTDNLAIGATPEAGEVTPAPTNDKPLAQSRTMAGAGVATAGGALIAVQEGQKALEAAQNQISVGTWIGVAIGALIIVGAGLAMYARWDDAGRPLPWSR